MPKTKYKRTSIVRARVDPKRKLAVDRIFGKLGITPTEAVNIFYAQVERHHGLPFTMDADRPLSRETLDAMNEDLSDARSYTAKELMEEIFGRKKAS
jgi:DNA-damage-inducible protein J